MTRIPQRTVTIIAACWALPYLASKIHHALQGRLGIHGGPVVTADDAVAYGGAAQVSVAQWGNAGTAVLLMIVTLLPLVPVTRRWNRWARTAPLFVATTFLLGMTILFLLRVLAGDGGLPLTLYLLAWTALLGLTALASMSTNKDPAGPQRERAATTLSSEAGSNQEAR